MPNPDIKRLLEKKQLLEEFISFCVEKAIKSIAPSHLLWELIDTSEEDFPIPTKKERENIINCSKRVLNSPHYKTIEDKVIHVFYFLIKHHYLRNGNKRFASLFLSLCLILFKKELHEKKIEMVALETAKSKSTDKEKTIEKLRNWLPF